MTSDVHFVLGRELESESDSRCILFQKKIMTNHCEIKHKIDVSFPSSRSRTDILVCYDPSFMKIKYFVQLSDIFAQKYTDI